MDKRQFAFNASDRNYVIKEKFGQDEVSAIETILNTVENQSNQVLGAIMFLCKEGDLNSLNHYIHLANTEEMVLRTSAEVKFERVTGTLK